MEFDILVFLRVIALMDRPARRAVAGAQNRFVPVGTVQIGILLVGLSN
jgi:hypothetical protein